MKGTIQVRGLKKSYGSHMILNGIDVQIEKGEIFALLGVNGAGNSAAVILFASPYQADGGGKAVRKVA